MKINSENSNLNLRHLRTVHAIWQEGSFSRAAAHLGVVPSVLTEAVKQIEAIIGAPLFDRRSRPPQPTPLGQEFLQETLPWLEGLDRALERIRDSADLAKGTLRIGASPSAITSYVAPAVAAFSARYPNVTVIIHDHVAERLALQVAEGQLDIAIAGSVTVSSDLEQTEIARDPFGLACRADHPLCRLGRPLTLNDVDPKDVVHLDGDTGTAQLLRTCPDIPEQLRSGTLYAHSTIAQLCLIRAGSGVGLLPRDAVKLFNDPNISFVDVQDLALVRRLLLISPAKRPLSHIAEKFIRLIPIRFGLNS